MTISPENGHFRISSVSFFSYFRGPTGVVDFEIFSDFCISGLEGFSAPYRDHGITTQNSHIVGLPEIRAH